MYDILKNIAESNDWVFKYARQDFQNLYDEMENDLVHLFVDPITIDTVFSATGNETITYSGKLMLLVSSDIGDDYETKYENTIKELIATSTSRITQRMICEDATINKFQTVEVINLFDYNLDGVLVNYSITITDY